MTDNIEVQALCDRVADLERRLAEHEEMRSGAFDALASVDERVSKLQDRMAAIPHPVREAARAEAAPALFAKLSARLGAAEEWLREMSTIVVEDHATLREIVEMLRSQRGPQAG